MADPVPYAAVTALAIAGGHCRTNMYMAASNRLWTAPTRAILGSSLMTPNASLMVGLPPPVPSSFLAVDSALFSPQSKEVSTPPRARNPTESSKGPVGPRDAAANPAS